MHHHVSVAVLHPADNLLKEVPCLVLRQPALLNNVIKQLTALHILHHNIDVCCGLNDLIQTDDVWMHEQAQDLDLTAHCSKQSKQQLLQTCDR